MDGEQDTPIAGRGERHLALRAGPPRRIKTRKFTQPMWRVQPGVTAITN
jgi:hypothetical protein